MQKFAPIAEISTSHGGIFCVHPICISYKRAFLCCGCGRDQVGTI